MYLYIIRHGETYGNLTGDGFTETDLTDKGLKQAFLLGERFKDEKIDAIYTSTLIRAVRTGGEIYKYHKNAKFNIFTTLMEKVLIKITLDFPTMFYRILSPTL
jgi:broad specificity phosphatase PhoE